MKPRGPNEPFVRNPQSIPARPAEHPVDSPLRTLGVELGEIVDDARQLVTDLGLRPYRVFSVTVRWSGGEIGRGSCGVTQVQEILPTPRLDEFSGVRGEPKSGGIAERGDARLRQISTRYTEEQVRGLFGCSNQVPPGHEVWIEVVEDARAGKPRRRRFIVSGVPTLDLERGFEWRATLLRQDQDRDRDGIPYPYTTG